jgi:bifunctional non-homologous end joining protein LigD
MVWDTGTYRLLGGTPANAYENGLLHFQLAGRKLSGEWTLVRMKHSRSKKTEWLLLKSGESTEKLPAQADDRSALSDRTMSQIADDKNATWKSNR